MGKQSKDLALCEVLAEAEITITRVVDLIRELIGRCAELEREKARLEIQNNAPRPKGGRKKKADV